LQFIARFCYISYINSYISYINFGVFVVILHRIWETIQIVRDKTSVFIVLG